MPRQSSWQNPQRHFRAAARALPDWVVDFVAALVIALLASAAYPSGIGSGYPLNSDGVMSYVLYDDFFGHGGNPHSWIYPGAPNWLPDVALAWLVRAFDKDMLHDVFIYGVVQSTIFFLLARWIYLILDRNGGRWMWQFWLFAWAMLTASATFMDGYWYGAFYSYLFHPNFHGGTLVAAVAAFGLLLSSSRTCSRWGLFATALISYAMLVSDQLFALYFVLPAIPVLIVPGLAPKRWRAATIAAFLLAGLAYEITSHTFGKPFFNTDYSVLPDAKLIEHSIRSFIGDFGYLLKQDVVTSLYEGAALSAVVWLLMSRRKDFVENSFALRSLMIFIAGSICLPFAASIVTGLHIAPASFRYCQTICLASIAIPIVLRPQLAQSRNWTGRDLQIAAVAVLALVCLCRVAVRDGSQSADSQGSQNDCEKNVLDQYRIRTGFANYWSAMRFMARDPDVNIIPLTAKEVFPHVHLNMNLDWLSPKLRGEIGSHEFVDENGLDPSELDALFGIPDTSMHCPESTIRVYRRLPGRLGLLASIYGKHQKRLNSARFDGTGFTDVPAALWAVVPDTLYGEEIALYAEFPAQTTILSATLRVNAGATRLWVDYRAEDATPTSTLAYYVMELDETDVPLHELASGQLPLDSENHLQTLVQSKSGAVSIPVNLSVRLVASGRVNAVVRSIGWTR